MCDAVRFSLLPPEQKGRHFSLLYSGRIGRMTFFFFQKLMVGKKDLLQRVSLIFPLFTGGANLRPWLALFLSLRQKPQQKKLLLHKRGPGGTR